MKARPLSIAAASLLVLSCKSAHPQQSAAGAEPPADAPLTCVATDEPDGARDVGDVDDSRNTPWNGHATKAPDAPAPAGERDPFPSVISAISAAHAKGWRADPLWRAGRERHGSDPQRAKALYEAATHEDPSFAPAWNGLGLLAAERGDRKEAERLYLVAVTAQPRYTHGLYNLAHLCFLERRHDDAARYATAVLAIDPSYTAAANLLRKMGD